MDTNYETRKIEQICKRELQLMECLKKHCVHKAFLPLILKYQLNYCLDCRFLYWQGKCLYHIIIENYYFGYDRSQ